VTFLAHPKSLSSRNIQYGHKLISQVYLGHYASLTILYGIVEPRHPSVSRATLKKTCKITAFSQIKGSMSQRCTEMQWHALSYGKSTWDPNQPAKALMAWLGGHTALNSANESDAQGSRRMRRDDGVGQRGWLKLWN